MKPVKNEKELNIYMACVGDGLISNQRHNYCLNVSYVEQVLLELKLYFYFICSCKVSK